MKKSALIALAVSVLFLTGCAKPPAANPDTTQPTTQIIQSVNADKPADASAWLTYQNDYFSVKYPTYLTPKVKPDGVGTTVSFVETAPLSDFPRIFSITSMPNPPGSNLDSWANEITSTGRMIKQGSIKISGQTAHILILEGTEAGPTYIFLSQDYKTRFEMYVSLKKETADLVLASFKFSNYAPLSRSVPIDPNFQITNIDNASHFPASVSAIFPIYAYMCDTYADKNGIPQHYSKIDFFISRDIENAPVTLLGMTPAGSAGSGECDLMAKESTLKDPLDSEKYRVWAVRYIDGKPDKRTADVQILITQPKLSSAAAKIVIANRAQEVILAIKNKDSAKLATFVHPNLGVRFSPYTYVSTTKDLIFKAPQLQNIFSDTTKYSWGNFDGSGLPIELTFKAYYQRFIYDEDFANAKEIGYNQIIGQGNMLNNNAEVYPNAITVEWNFPGINQQYGGMDWKSLRLVFEYDGVMWYVVGVIHDQWTI
ncbi:MAG: hypothetical protein Q7S66_00935 [bacterium]|nr:hypothetical protein [bacterium]